MYGRHVTSVLCKSLEQKSLLSVVIYCNNALVIAVIPLQLLLIMFHELQSQHRICSRVCCARMLAASQTPDLTFPNTYLLCLLSTYICKSSTDLDNKSVIPLGLFLGCSIVILSNRNITLWLTPLLFYS